MMPVTVADYEELRRKHLADAMAILPERLAALAWPPERIRAERERSLRRLIRIAKERSAWHAKRLTDIDAERVTEANLARIPPMTKDDLMAHWDEIVTDTRVTLERAEARLVSLTGDSYLLDRYHVVASAGSSGRRGVFVYDWEGWLLCFLGSARALLAARARRPELAAAPVVVAHVTAEKSSHMTGALSQTFRYPESTSYSFPARLPLERIVAGLNRTQPSILVGYASLLYQLSFAARDGSLRISPKLIASVGEPLLAEIHEALERTWSAPALNIWATSEAGTLAASCGEEQGMHLNEDLVIVEPVDAEGNPVPAGVRSAKIYLTNLFNLAQPLVRYELSDEVTFLEGPCSCGSAFRRVDDIQGRQDECFTYPGGPVVHPIVFRSPLGRERNILEYQVHQTRRGAEITIRRAGEVNTDKLRKTIEDGLGEAGLIDPEVSIASVDSLGREKIGKLKRFVPL